MSRNPGDWGYPSQLPCAVCGLLTRKNMAEPRFYYTVCPAHQGVPPTQIPDAPDPTRQNEEPHP